MTADSIFRLFASCVAGLSLCCLAATASGKDWLLVVNKNDRSLGIIDPQAGAQAATVPLDEITGHEVAASPDGKLAFVPIYGSGGVGGPGTDGSLIRVIDLAERTTIHTIDLGRGLRPHEALIGPRDGLLYVTTELASNITVIDPRTFQVLHHIPTGKEESHMLALSHDGRRGYTANVRSGTVSVLDIEARKVLRIVPVADKIQRISVSVDDARVFTADQRSPRLAVIDTGTFAIQWIALPGVAYGTAPTPGGRHLLVALPGARKVAVVDLKTLETGPVMEVPRAPQEIVARPDGQAAYVSCDASAKVAELDLKNWKVARLMEVGRGADGLAWASASR